MKKANKNKYLRLVIFLIIALLFVSVKGIAQEDQIPPFKMMMSNGTFFTSKDIPKGKPVVLIYFAPDCSHCQKLLGAFFKRIKEFKSAEIILLTFKPLSELTEFEKQNELSKYHNIVAGTEGNTFYLRYFYKILNTPFTALYNKKGKLLITYRKETNLDDLSRKVKSLK